MITTYTNTHHIVSGAPIISRTGRKQGEIEQPSRCKATRNVYALKHECELSKQTDNIILMSRNELRKARRKNKKSNNLKK